MKYIYMGTHVHKISYPTWVLSLERFQSDEKRQAELRGLSWHSDMYLSHTFLWDAPVEMKSGIGKSAVRRGFHLSGMTLRLYV